MRDPHTLQLVMDSLRYWVTEMHVDGFRFDLASTLARSLHEVDRLSAFFDLVQQDPVISQVKLIAEPWDVGEGGYQVGNFPPLWAEWNGKYRDSVRDFWRGADCGVGELAYRLTGSSDLYEDDARRPHASINFVTAHDGFPLTDLVSYNEKHNEANGEGNGDGESFNRSWNCGAEGPTDDPAVRRLPGAAAAQPPRHAVPVPGRADAAARRRARPHPARQQQRLLPGQRDLLDRLVVARRGAARLHRRAHLAPPAPTPRSGAASSSRARRSACPASVQGSPTSPGSTPSGEEMTDEQWHESHARCLAAFVNGDDVGTDRRGERVVDDRFLVLFNGHHETLAFTLPPQRWGTGWLVAVDTATGAVGPADGPAYKAGDVVEVGGPFGAAAAPRRARHLTAFSPLGVLFRPKCLGARRAAYGLDVVAPHGGGPEPVRHHRHTGRRVSATVVVAGEVDSASAAELTAAFDAELVAGATTMRLDLSDTSFVDSSGLVVLLDLRAARGRPLTADLRLVRPSSGRAARARGLRAPQRLRRRVRDGSRPGASAAEDLGQPGDGEDPLERLGGVGHLVA